ncbi:MAG: CAP domain-containing protein, partial [Actinomycetota bacterium]|nr:CAP domain-containing protein [Actinomycetota bacterium]
MRIPPLLRSAVGLLSLLAVTVALLLVPSTAASAAGEEGDFVNRLNALRTSRGLAPLAVYGDLTSIARAHSQRMGEQNSLYHNPNLTTEVTNWQSVGENVGYGGSVVDIQNAFVASPPHLANQVNTTYTQVGIGTWVAPTGRIWVTQVFRKPLVANPLPAVLTISPTLSSVVGAYAGVLGAPVTAEYAVPGGLEQDFQGGDALWGPNTGSRVVLGALRDRYRAIGGARSVLGLPATNELTTPNGVGKVNHFQGGSIFYSPATGANEITIGIRDAWARTGWENGPLGFPTTGQLTTPNGVGLVNHFQGGSIFYSPATGAREVTPGIRDAWARVGWENGRLGFPTTHQQVTPDSFGRVIHFQGGSIFWSPTTGAHAVDGGIRDRWASTGWERGRLGYPVSDAYPIAEGFRQD